MRLLLQEEYWEQYLQGSDIHLFLQGLHKTSDQRESLLQFFELHEHLKRPGAEKVVRLRGSIVSGLC